MVTYVNWTGTLVRPSNILNNKNSRIYRILEYECLRTDSKDVIAESPDAKDIIQCVLKTITDIVSLVSCTPTNLSKGKNGPEL